MKPLIFEFIERPSAEKHDYSLIKYDNHLNLSIDIATGQPAISVLNMSTETFTKSQGEGSDSDRNPLSNLMTTSTGTYDNTEVSDSDKDRNALERMMATTTLTETIETADRDKNRYVINNHSQN